MDSHTPPELIYHRLVEATKFAYAKRSELADEDFVDIRDVSVTTAAHKFYDNFQEWKNRI